MTRRILPLLLLFGSVAVAQEIYLKPTEALKVIFHDSKEVTAEKKTLSESQKAVLKKKLGEEVRKEVWNFYIARSGKRIDGYAVVDSETGKTEPITFMTAITPEGRVKEVEILVYREPIGSEVHQKPFLKQYEGKRSSDPIRIGQDIANISGATISSRAVSTGVKRGLALWEVFYGQQ
jgi:Na+-translocating ferredoxin:NAD+ oxidoreductase RnfG subunit